MDNNTVTFTKKLSDPPTSTSEQSSANNQEQEETDAPTSIAERSLMAKKLHTTLRDSNALVVDRSDPNSPLYSLTSFQELKLKPELLNGKSIVENKNCRLN
jgi:ATP-dependent RNA helicase DDX19/DBP5